MEKTEEHAKTCENHEKTPEKTERKERVAVCLVCSNEWIAITGNNRKPSKCPECGTRKCIWKDELPKPQTKTSEKSMSSPEKSCENHEKTPEKTEEKREKNIGFILPDGSGVAFGTIGSDEPEKIKEKTSEEKTAPGNFPVVLVLAGLVVLGTLAGVGWFLGRRKNYVSKPVSAVTRPPPQAERAMTRMGGI
ncbi:hypothetical protein McpSp1_09090 [Methanocorpusculaceae archaeon Sp1]|nr:hypothetical protein [Methanocorpusculaceae archaeon Sp1]